MLFKVLNIVRMVLGMFNVHQKLTPNYKLLTVVIITYVTKVNSFDGGRSSTLLVLSDAETGQYFGILRRPSGQ